MNRQGTLQKEVEKQIGKPRADLNKNKSQRQASKMTCWLIFEVYYEKGELKMNVNVNDCTITDGHLTLDWSVVQIKFNKSIAITLFEGEDRGWFGEFSDEMKDSITNSLAEEVWPLFVEYKATTDQAAKLRLRKKMDYAVIKIRDQWC